MRAAACVRIAAGTAGQDGLAAHPPGVDRPERGGGEGGEHARMRRDRVGDAFAAGQACADELAGVALVDLRAGGADGLAAVAARGEQHPAGLGRRVVDRGAVRRSRGRWRRSGPGAGWGGCTGRCGVLVIRGEEVGPGRGWACRRRMLPSPGLVGPGMRGTVAAVLWLASPALLGGLAGHPSREPISAQE